MRDTETIPPELINLRQQLLKTMNAADLLDKRHAKHRTMVENRNFKTLKSHLNHAYNYAHGEEE